MERKSKEKFTNNNKSNEKDSLEKENENEFLKEKREELKKAVLDFKGEDNKLEKMLKLLNMVQLSSTIKILKDDNAPIEIIPHLYLGSIGSASNLKELQNCKITHIVCCARGIKNFFPNNFKYLNLDLLDSETVDIKKYFEESGKFINEAIKNNGNVLVHCHAGVSRSSTILIAYVMKYQGMKFDKVLELLRSKREKVNPNEGFIKQLKEYEKEIFRQK